MLVVIIMRESEMGPTPESDAIFRAIERTPKGGALVVDRNGPRYVFPGDPNYEQYREDQRRLEAQTLFFDRGLFTSRRKLVFKGGTDGVNDIELHQSQSVVESFANSKVGQALQRLTRKPQQPLI